CRVSRKAMVDKETLHAASPDRRWLTRRRGMPRLYRRGRRWLKSRKKKKYFASSENSRIFAVRNQGGKCPVD
ncbi:MAG: hypothetical protein II849_01470, partial [Bacteroidales bacterium]|nr:hypothetical protein [Bacteroidales bacterium]